MINSKDILNTIASNLGFKPNKEKDSFYKDYPNNNGRIPKVRISNHRSKLATWLIDLNDRGTSKRMPTNYFISIVFENTPTVSNNIITGVLNKPIIVHEYIYDCNKLETTDIQKIFKSIKEIKTDFNDRTGKSTYEKIESQPHSPNSTTNNKIINNSCSIDSSNLLGNNNNKLMESTKQKFILEQKSTGRRFSVKAQNLQEAKQKLGEYLKEDRPIFHNPLHWVNPEIKSPNGKWVENEEAELIERIKDHIEEMSYEIKQYEEFRQSNSLYNDKYWYGEKGGYRETTYGKRNTGGDALMAAKSTLKRIRGASEDILKYVEEVLSGLNSRKFISHSDGRLQGRSKITTIGDKGNRSVRLSNMPT
jgi:hypothetical protein